MNKPFFYRIESAELLDFATDPEGEGMTLLRFAKELQKGESDIEFIQKIIDEAHNYIEKKKKAGAKGGKAKASSAKASPSSAKAESSTPLASSSSSSSSSSSTVTETKDLKSKSIEIPDFINADSLIAFQEMRKKIKKPLTEKATVMLINKLTKFHNKGFDVNDILDTSTMNCYQGVFEPKQQAGVSGGRVKSFREQANEGAVREFLKDNGA